LINVPLSFKKKLINNTKSRQKLKDESKQKLRIKI